MQAGNVAPSSRPAGTAELEDTEDQEGARRILSRRLLQIESAPDESFSFSTVVTNGGPETSTASLVVSLTGPASAVAVNNSRCSVAGLTVTCSFAGLTAGSSKTVVTSGTASGKGTLVASAVVHGSVADPNAGNDRSDASIQVR